VAYSLEFHREHVLLYLRNREGLSREARVKLFVNLNEDLRERAEFYRGDPERRLAPGSNCFWYDIIFRDPHTGVVHWFRFVVDDASAKYGVLRVLFVDEGPPGPMLKG
jgi:hypothetical protein